MRLPSRRILILAAGASVLALFAAACGSASGTPTPLTLGGGSQIVGFTATATPHLPKSEATTPPATGGATQPASDPGAKLFLSLPCKACHTIDSLKSQGATGAVGPNLTHLATAAETRKAGMNAEAYIRESIDKPGAFIVPSFFDAMPAGLVPAGDMDKLVAYLLTLK